MRSYLLLVVSLLVSWCSIAAENTINNLMTSEEEVTRLALDTLSQKINADRKNIQLIHLARFNWPDAALGCPKPGIVYTQAIVPGHLALLKHGDKQYRVHLGNGRGLVCNLRQIPVKLDQVILDNLGKMAVEDLANKLGVNIESIKVVEDQNRVWPDSNFGCAGISDESETKSIRGHLIKLAYQGRIFEYRTSRTAVKACPPIESE